MTIHPFFLIFPSLILLAGVILILMYNRLIKERKALQQKQTAFEQKQMAFEQKQTAFEQKQTAFEQKQMAFEQKQMAFEQEKMGLQALHEVHQREKTDLVAANTALQQNYDMIEREVRTLDRKLGEVRSQRDQLASALRSINWEHDKLNKKYNALVDDNSFFKLEIRDLKSEKVDLKSEVRTLDRDHQYMCSERDKYRNYLVATLTIFAGAIVARLFNLM